MAEPLAVGAACDFLYSCTALEDRAGFEARVREAWPGAEVRCGPGRDCVEHLGATVCACSPDITGFCVLAVGEVDEEEFLTAAGLCGARGVNHLVCAGDL